MFVLQRLTNETSMKNFPHSKLPYRRLVQIDQRGYACSWHYRLILFKEKKLSGGEISLSYLAQMQINVYVGFLPNVWNFSGDMLYVNARFQNDKADKISMKFCKCKRTSPCTISIRQGWLVRMSSLRKKFPHQI